MILGEYPLLTILYKFRDSTIYGDDFIISLNPLEYLKGYNVIIIGSSKDKVNIPKYEICNNVIISDTTIFDE